MATCSKCGEFDDEGHRCSRWIYARACWRIARAALVGGTIGFIVLAPLFGHVSWLAIIVAAAIGVLVDSRL